MVSFNLSFSIKYEEKSVTDSCVNSFHAGKIKYFFKNFYV